MKNFARNPLRYLPDGQDHGGFSAVTKIYALKYKLDFLKVWLYVQQCVPVAGGGAM